MNEIEKQFVSEEPKNFRFKIGNVLASGLSGFIAGVIFTTIILGAVIVVLLNRQ